MDEIVRAAMEKWPNVPDLYGWLALDGRGRFLLQGARVGNPAMEAFFSRNYDIDPAGRAFVQNGPQRVYVAFGQAPYLARRRDGGFSLHPGLHEGVAGSAWLTPEGEIYLSVEGRLALLDGPDIAPLVAAACRPDGMPAEEDDWQGLAEGRGMLRLRLPEGEVNLAPATHPLLVQQFGLQPTPEASG
ncbi:DUF2946 family protein [Gulbenkiania mobilis]|uniref:DUF2946 family protein n=1 Tax=Gulbenkiania mobilis TaxID=397457 RepID=A0ABY2D1E8_GULMO|nr:DUF2946 family protein [Gulbenkiania mobilis]